MAGISILDQRQILGLAQVGPDKLGRDEGKDHSEHDGTGGHEVPVLQHVDSGGVDAQSRADRLVDAAEQHVQVAHEDVGRHTGVTGGISQQDAQPGVIAHCGKHRGGNRRTAQNTGVGSGIGVDGDKGDHCKDHRRLGSADEPFDKSTEQAHIFSQADRQHQQTHHHHGREIIVDAVHVLGHIGDRVLIDQVLDGDLHDLRSTAGRGCLFIAGGGAGKDHRQHQCYYDQDTEQVEGMGQLVTHHFYAMDKFVE